MRHFARSTVVAALCVMLASSMPAAAQTLTQFRLPPPGPAGKASPWDITDGGDGYLWFTERLNNKIGRITRTGAITEFPLPDGGSQPWSITKGPDGNLWFTEASNKIGRITPTGVITEFPIPGYAVYITTGPDGNLWFTRYFAGKIGRMTPTGVVTEFTLPIANSVPGSIAAGPDGNLWFTESVRDPATGAFSGAQIGQITPTGVITEFPLPDGGSQPGSITKGPDGNLWFTEASNKIGRITPGGVIIEFRVPSVFHPGDGGARQLTAGPDGNLWFLEISAGKIGRITPSGITTEFPGVRELSGPAGITAGPDGNIWFVEMDDDKIGRFMTPATCAITLNRTTFIVGQTVTVATLRFANPSATPAAVEIKLWFDDPDHAHFSLADGSFSLPALFDQDLGPLTLFTIGSSFPRGTFSFNCRILWPLTGGLQTEAFAPFEVLPFP